MLGMPAPSAGGAGGREGGTGADIGAGAGISGMGGSGEGGGVKNGFPTPPDNISSTKGGNGDGRVAGEGVVCVARFRFAIYFLMKSFRFREEGGVAPPGAGGGVGTNGFRSGLGAKPW
jgi:hypothetical protein